MPKSSKIDILDITEEELEEEHNVKGINRKSEKQKAIKKKEHISNLLLNWELEELCKNLPRIVIFLDNLRAHKTDLVLDIAKSLNIYLLPPPEYSSGLASVELVLNILKESLKRNKLTTNR